MKREVGMPFRTLPLRLRQRWWETTFYGKHSATNELMWTIESINPEAAEYLARGDAERIKQTWGDEAENNVSASFLRHCNQIAKSNNPDLNES